MTDHGRFWPGRRVFVLGCTGFLGGWAVRGLLARGAEVVGLVRRPNPESEFFRDKLYRRVHVAHGRADDVTRLRTLIAVYEAELVVQCAADPDGSADAYYRAVAAAAGPVPVVVPVHPGVATRPRPTAGATGNVTLVRLPMLFGGGDRRWHRWPPRALASAAVGTPPPPPPVELVGAPVLSVRDAVEGLLDAVAAQPTGPHLTDVTPQGTAADLFAAVARLTAVGPRLHDTTGMQRSLAAAAAEAVEWYRSTVPEGLSPPAPRAAA